MEATTTHTGALATNVAAYVEALTDQLASSAELEAEEGQLRSMGATTEDLEAIADYAFGDSPFESVAELAAHLDAANSPHRTTTATRNTMTTTAAIPPEDMFSKLVEDEAYMEALEAQDFEEAIGAAIDVARDAGVEKSLAYEALLQDAYEEFGLSDDDLMDFEERFDNAWSGRS